MISWLQKWPNRPISILSGVCIYLHLGIFHRHIIAATLKYNCSLSIATLMMITKKDNETFEVPRHISGNTQYVRPFEETWHFHSDSSSQEFRKKYFIPLIMVHALKNKIFFIRNICTLSHLDFNINSPNLELSAGAILWWQI